MARKITKRRGQGGGTGSPLTRPTSGPDQNEFGLIRTLLNILHYHLNKDQSAFMPARKKISAIRRILSIYSRLVRECRHQSTPSVIFNQSLQDFILYSVAYLCYSNRIEDTKLVTWLLIHMFKAYGQFMFLFQATFPHPTRDFIWGNAITNRTTSTTTSSSPSGSRHPFAYFVRHAVRAKLQFRQVRFLDLRLTHPNEFHPCPIYLAASLGEVELLKYLLHMGANLGIKQFHEQLPFLKPPWVCSLIVKLLSNALRNGILNDFSFVETNTDEDDAAEKAQKRQNEIECLRLLLRAVPVLNLKWFYYRQNAFWKQIFVTAEDMVFEMSDLLPKLKQRCIEPPDLKHCCRIVIRETLRKNWKMPNGIYELEIPSSLIKFIDLEED